MCTLVNKHKSIVSNIFKKTKKEKEYMSRYIYNMAHPMP